MTKQPQWKLVAQLGDAHPLDYGGYFIYEDQTGVYPPEAEYLEVDEYSGKLTAYRFPLERCTLINGVLSDNSFHPEHPAWFADDLPGVASCNGVELEELQRLLCSDKSTDLAQAYRMIGEFHGFENLDEYPITLNRVEAHKRYKK